MKICSGNKTTFGNESSWCGAIFDVPRSRETLASLEAKIAQPDFWQDQEQAQRIMQQRKAADEVIASDAKLARILSDIETYFHLAEEETDPAGRDSLLREIDKEIDAAETYVSELETVTLLSGESDRSNAILTIKPGAGGTESQDWAEMLLRMYLRWAERHKFPTEVYDVSYGEAGIKSTTFAVNSPYAYGTLRGEQGTHRMVRISKYDNQGRRQTSFAGVDVVPVVEQTDHVDIPDDEIRVDVFRSSGPGG